MARNLQICVYLNHLYMLKADYAEPALGVLEVYNLNSQETLQLPLINAPSFDFITTQVK